MTKKIKIRTESEDIDDIFLYLKSNKDSIAYEKYILPIIKRKGREYVDKLLGSTILVLSEHNLKLDDLSLDKNGKLTLSKDLKGVNLLDNDTEK